jgi:hypothetical protein
MARSGFLVFNIVGKCHTNESTGLSRHNIGRSQGCIDLFGNRDTRRSINVGVVVRRDGSRGLEYR